MLVCASRRTDIPAFHSEWLMNRLRAGYVLVRNPVCRNVVYKVDLSPGNVDCLLFITKDPRPLIPYLKEIASMGYMYTFQVTITPYGKDLERNVPLKADIADAFREISKKIGKDRIVWRYDPIIMNDRIGLQYHERKFKLLCGELEGYTDRCIISFLDMYGKLSSHRDVLRSASKKEMEQTAEMMVGIAKDHHIKVTHCCARYDLSKYGVDARGCIDRESMMSLNIPFEEMSSPLRDGCKCVKNIDIGAYDTCLHDCIYCYANSSADMGRRERRYDPGSEMLMGSVDSKDEIVELASRSFPRLFDF